MASNIFDNDNISFKVREIFQEFKLILLILKASMGQKMLCDIEECKVENATDRSPLLPRNQISGRRNFRPIPNLHTENNVEGSENRLEGKKKTSDAGTLLHLVKGNVGTGILAMAMALSNFGLVAGAIGICVLGSCCTYCMKLLVYCSQMAVDEQTGRNQSPEPQTESVPSSANAAVRADQGMQINYQDSENQAFEENSSLDYAGTAYAAFLHGPKCLQRLAFPMRYIVNALLILTQFGFCCVYLLFVGQSLREVFLNTKFLTSLNTTAIMALELLVMIPLNFIPDLDTLTVVSTTAVCLQSVGLLMMFVDFCSGPLSDSYILYLAPAWKWPLFFGTAMFSFEGIGVILPLEMEMKNKRNFPRILYGGMTIVTCMYLLIGIGGYLKYGADVKPSITFNLPAGCTSELIRSLFALAIFLSYPLQMYVPLSFVMPYLKGIFLPERRNRWVERAADWLIRATFVLIT
ncbi:unnamed protein product, partial [Larinioides sclopetarius]